MNKLLQQINQDKEPKFSINRLKAERLKYKYAPRSEHRTQMLTYLRGVIHFKQSLYFRILQGVKGWIWGMSLRK